MLAEPQFYWSLLEPNKSFCGREFDQHVLNMRLKLLVFLWPIFERFLIVKSPIS